jgi:hypothetical protein
MYNARVHSYKAGNPTAREMTDDEAIQYANENGIPQPVLGHSDNAGPAPVNDQDAIAEQLMGAAPVTSMPSPDDSKTPKGKGRKRKSTAVDDDDASAKAATPASPAKQRKRQSKAAEPVSEEPKKSGRKKKA